MFASKDTLLTRPSGYNIARSVRLRSSASAYFNRTPASAGNRQKFTISAWVKRGKLTTSSGIFGAGATSANEDRFMFAGNDTLLFDSYIPGTNFNLNSTAVYRDPSAWYHVVGAVDTTQATASDRVKLYVNGAQITSFVTATYPAQNANCNINNNVAQYIGNNPDNYYYDGYLTEINFIDGQALTPSSFGETDTTTGVWKPKKYAGTYGTNGFYLNFSDNSSNTATTIGKDYSGNGNNCTPNNISVTAGATYDSMTDVPTLTSATAANYCVLNPLSKDSSVTLSDANLTYSISGAGNGYPTSTFQFDSGKWYWEVTISGIANLIAIALGSTDPATAGFTSGYGYYQQTGNKWVNGSNTAYGSSYTSGDVIGVAVDMTALTVTFYKNNVSQGAISIAAGSYKVSGGNGASGTVASGSYNFGQRPFSYTPPTGYVALNTYNLPASTIKNGAAYMAATTYTGNGSTQSISNSVNSISFQPDFVWLKSRSNAYSHALFDSVRGATKQLSSDSTGAEATYANSMTAFNSNGFSVGSDAIGNGNTSTFVGWQWKAGGTSSSNTNGSITSTVSVGATQGFSVVTYTGTGANATVGHGLGVAPKMIIIKNRGDVSDWAVWHTGLSGNSYYIYLNKTSAQSNVNAMWNNTAPTSTVFSLGTSTDSNDTKAMVAYCFSAVAGYSAFGSFVANASADGPFIYTGFRPRWIMIKRSSAAGAPWSMFDTSRNTYNSTNLELDANTSSAESTSGNGMDILSNGFKLRDSAYLNSSSGDTFIYAAFAEVGFKSALAR